MSEYYGDVVVSTGEYVDSQGQNKKRWTKLGAAFYDPQHDSYSIKLDALPMPKPDGCWLKIFKKDQQQQPVQQQPVNTYNQGGQQQPVQYQAGPINNQDVQF